MGRRGDRAVPRRRCRRLRRGGSSSSSSQSAKLAAALLLAGREDARHAAADALAEALGLEPDADAGADADADAYARCIAPAGVPETSSDENGGFVSAGGSAGGSYASLYAGSIGRGGRSDGVLPPPPGAEHTQFSCDACDASPILGHRWHCATCVDYDLCDRCFRRGVPAHDPTHRMLAYECGVAAGGSLSFSSPGGFTRERLAPGRREPLAGGLASVARAEASTSGIAASRATLRPPTRERKPARGSLASYWARARASEDASESSSGPTPGSRVDRSVVTPGRLALVAALAGADDGALGVDRGVAECSSYFVLLRRLAETPEYAATVRKAARRAAEDAAAAQRAAFESDASDLGRSGAGTPGVGPGSRRAAAAREKLILRLALLSAARCDDVSDDETRAAGPPPPGSDGSDDASFFASSLARDLVTVVERLRRARGAVPAGAGAASLARWGDPAAPPEAHLASASANAPSDSSDAEHYASPGVPGYGAPLSPAPPFGPTRPGATLAASEEALDAAMLDAALGAALAAARTEKALRPRSTSHGSSAAEDDSGDGRRAETEPSDVRSRWLKVLAGILADGARAKSCPTRRLARRALLLVAGSREAYRARDDAKYADACDRVRRATMPRGLDARFLDRAPYAAALRLRRRRRRRGDGGAEARWVARIRRRETRRASPSRASRGGRRSRRRSTAWRRSRRRWGATATRRVAKTTTRTTSPRSSERRPPRAVPRRGRHL